MWHSGLSGFARENATMRFDPDEGILDIDEHLDRLMRSAEALGFDFDRHAARNELQAATFGRKRPAAPLSDATTSRFSDVPLARISRLPDEELITTITRVKGIGRWTAQMFLMFRLGRLDVLPELDLGVQKDHPSPRLASGYPGGRRPPPQDSQRRADRRWRGD